MYRVLLFATALLLLNSSWADRKPNIVLMITDDQGWGDLSIHGNSNIKTPNIDSLGHSGANFKFFYVSPVCAPTRASMFTGRYAKRTGAVGVNKGGERIDTDETLLSEILKQNGYVTGGFGKWHNGLQYPYHPNSRGFDEWYGFCCGHWSNYFDAPVQHNGVEMYSKGFLPDDLTDKAMDFMEKNKGKPFFCYIPYNTPHGPMQVPDKYFDAVKARGLKMFNRDKAKEDIDFTIAALAMCENIDWNVGRVLKKLKELKLEEDTIVIYMSDNGPNSFRWNAGMKGKKGGVDEGGVRSPFFIKWPGKIKPSKIDSISAHIDLLPTLCDLAGIKPKLNKKLDGISLKNLILNGEKPKDRFIVSTWGKKISIRSQKYRADFKGLYDMENDLGQTKNLKNTEKEIFTKMQQKLKDFQKEFAAESSGYRPITAGHPDELQSKLPVRECKFSGDKIRRSAKSANDTHIVNWIDSKEYPYWDIELLSSGTYEIFIDYTCSVENLGCEILIDFKGKKVQKTIDTAFDPKLIDSPDRVKRTQSYDKKFKRLSLGKVKLDAGKGILSVRCTKQTGKGIIDLKNVYLKHAD